MSRTKANDAGLIHKQFGGDWRKTAIKDSTSEFSDPHQINAQIRALDHGARLRRTDSDREPAANESGSASNSASASDDEPERQVARDAKRSVSMDAGKCGPACRIRGPETLLQRLRRQAAAQGRCFTFEAAGGR